MAPRQRRPILFVVNVTWFFLSHRLPLARAARAAGFEVHLLAAGTTAAEAHSLRREGITLHTARLSRGGFGPLADLQFLLRTLQVMRAVSPLLVHNVTVKPVLYGTVAARLLRVPAIVNAISGFGYAFSHESRRVLAGLLRSAYRLVLRTPRAHVIFQNADDLGEFVSRGLVAAGQGVLIPGSGVDLTCYQATGEDQTEAPLVVLPARILRDKGVVEFAAAARLLRSRGCGARMILAGPLDPPNPASLSSAQLAELTADGCVEWLGPVADMPELYRRSHIVCLPSYREGLPKCLIEACAAGRPIVTTDVPGCRAVVAHEVNGLLVPVRDATGLADALQLLIENPALRARLGQAGRRRAEREFGVELVVQRTMQVYEQALAQWAA